MEKEKARPIIIIKKKAPHGGHHGGAWKVAYADFVTAMMALGIGAFRLYAIPAGAPLFPLFDRALTKVMVTAAWAGAAVNSATRQSTQTRNITAARTIRWLYIKPPLPRPLEPQSQKPILTKRRQAAL